jgi:hypothetical protein
LDPVDPSVELVILLTLVLAMLPLVACSSSGAGLNAAEAGPDVQEAAEQQPEARESTGEDGLAGLLAESEESTGWAVRCVGDRHCVYQRKVPVRDARGEDFLILQVDLDSPGRPDLLVMVAPRRAKESAGIKIAFLSQVGGEAEDLPPFSSFPLRCLGTGCGAAIPLTTELNGGTQIADQLSSSRVLWVLYELDGKPTRSLIALEPLRAAIEETGRAAANSADPAHESAGPSEQR